MSEIPSIIANPPLIGRSTTAIYYRERTNFWLQQVAAMPEANPQRALHLEIAKSYERLAACYEQREPPPIKENCLMTSSGERSA